MPIYEYVCQNCGTQFDALRSMKEADSTIACKKCSSTATQRKLSVFFAQSGGHSVTKETHSCGGCGGGSCASCGSHNN